MHSFGKKIRNKILSFLSNDIGIDLGTTNTLVYLRGKGIIINEPSVVAVNQKTGQVVDIGHGAKRMLGRTPSHIVAVRPLVDGVISNFEVTEEMLSYLIKKTQSKVSKKILGPRVIVGVPSGITNVERRAVQDATKNAGAREVYIVEEPVASAMGIRLPIHDPFGSMIIDIGGGTSDMAILSMNGVVVSRNIKIAGDRFDNDIISYIRDEFKILIGERTAENLKISIGSVIGGNSRLEKSVKGRDLITGLPKEVIITDSDIREALSHSISSFLESIKDVLEITPPEILSDIMHRGIFLVGGGALLKDLDILLSNYLKIPIFIADDPLTAVARGTGVLFERLDDFNAILIHDKDELPLQK